MVWCPMVQDNCDQGIFGLDPNLCHAWDEEVGCVVFGFMKAAIVKGNAPHLKPIPRTQRAFPMPKDLVEKLRQFGEGLL